MDFVKRPRPGHVSKIKGQLKFYTCYIVKTQRSTPKMFLNFLVYWKALSIVVQIYQKILKNA
jgi:hypothetical protein